MKAGKWKASFFSIFAVGLVLFGIFYSTFHLSSFLQGYLAVEKIEESNSTVKTVSASSKTEEEPVYASRPEKGEKFGTLVIPKLEAAMPIFEGADPDQLEKGVGHFDRSVLPGENNNAVLSGHRDTVFRELGKVGLNDLLIVRTEAGEFIYKVKKVRIVDADDRTVIVPKPDATLTLTTCYPFNFIGNAPERYVLVADLLKKQ